MGAAVTDAGGNAGVERTAAGAAPAVASRRPPLRLFLGWRAGGVSGAGWLVAPNMTGAGVGTYWTG